MGEFNPVPEIPWMITSDPPAHTRLRKLANKGFMPDNRLPGSIHSLCAVRKRYRWRLLKSKVGYDAIGLREARQ